MPISRRTFLSGAAAAALGAPLRAAGPLYIYGSESFVTFVREAPFVVGLLLTTKPDDHIRAIAELKRRTGFHGTFRYRTNDRRKISFARELLHYFVRFKDPQELQFAAALVTPARPLRGRALEDYRILQYSRLFQSAGLPHGGILRMHHYAKYTRDKITSDPAVDFARRADPLVKAGLIAGKQPISKTANDGLIELTSLLCGNLLHEACNRSGAMQSSSRAKLQIVARHRQLLTVEDLTKPVAPRWQPRVLDPA